MGHAGMQNMWHKVGGGEAGLGGEKEEKGEYEKIKSE
jgi:hypothetical protein